MLVLTRKEDESLLIGDNIRVMVVEIRGDKVRLGIDAPKDVAILRDDAKNKQPRHRGLAGANAEWDHYQAQDDQVLQQKMEDERDGSC